MVVSSLLRNSNGATISYMARNHPRETSENSGNDHFVKMCCSTSISTLCLPFLKASLCFWWQTPALDPVLVTVLGEVYINPHRTNGQMAMGDLLRRLVSPTLFCDTSVVCGFYAYGLRWWFYGNKLARGVSNMQPTFKKNSLWLSRIMRILLGVIEPNQASEYRLDIYCTI